MFHFSHHGAVALLLIVTAASSAPAATTTKCDQIGSINRCVTTKIEKRTCYRQTLVAGSIACDRNSSNSADFAGGCTHGSAAFEDEPYDCSVESVSSQCWYETREARGEVSDGEYVQRHNVKCP